MGKQVKLLRERAGWTQWELGERLGYSEEQISSVERGRRTPQPDFLDAADALLGAGGLLTVTKDDIAKAKAKARIRHPAWFRDYARLETEAVELNFYSTLTVPGLLQTREYAVSVFSAFRPTLSEEVIEERVSARLQRQELLSQWPAPAVTAVLDEGVLRRCIGGPEVLRRQLQHLLTLGALRSTTLQVLPLTCRDHGGFEGPFILLTPKGRPSVGYVEVQGVNRLITDPEAVRILASRYGSIRGQALTSDASLDLIKTLVGEG